MKRTILAVIVVAVVAPTATADFLADLQLQHTGVSPSRTMTIYGFMFEGGIGVYTGMYHHLSQNFNPDVEPYNELRDWGFCIEFNYSSGSMLDYDMYTLEQAPISETYTGDPMGDDKADSIRELWAEHIDDVHAGGADEAAAFQGAIWEIIYENEEATWDVTSWTYSGIGVNGSGDADSFYMTGSSTVTDLANDWLDDVADDGGPLFGNLVGLTREGAQDYVAEIPAPGAVLLGAVGLGLVGWARRRFG